jgi:hypothetical protein|tara:strand:+ start:2835 stop:2957 length:123 start_codon:yes stop_codon:yes gene_type:complete
MTALHHATQKAIILDRQFRARVIPNKTHSSVKPKYKVIYE